MKKIKSLIARTIKNLGKLTAFCCLLIPAFAICCLLGSWTYDNDTGLLIADNIQTTNDWGVNYASNINVTKQTQGSNYYSFLVSNYQGNNNISYAIGTNNNLVSSRYIVISTNQQIYWFDDIYKMEVEYYDTNRNIHTNNYISSDYYVNNLNSTSNIPYTIKFYNVIENFIVLDLGNINYCFKSISFETNNTIITQSGFTINQVASASLYNLHITLTNKFQVNPSSYSKPLINSWALEDYQSWYYDEGTEEFISKNLWNLKENDIEFGSLNGATGEDYPSNQRIRIKNTKKIFLLSGTYSLSFDNLDEYYWNGYLNANDTGGTYNLNGSWLQNGERFTLTDDCYIRIAFRYSDNRVIQNVSELSNVMLNEGSISLPYLPYGILYSQEEYNNLENDYNNYQNTHSYTNTQYNDLNNNYNTLQDQYNNLEQDYDTLERQYETLNESKSINYDNYTIKLVSYETAQTTQNYTEIQTLITRQYVNEQGFLDIKAIRQINGFGSTWDGIVVECENDLNIYNYNLLFNGSGSANLDFALEYTYFGTPTYTVLKLSNIVGDTAYYGYFDLISLFGKNNIDINNQNVLYNKFAVHWTNIPSDTDLVNIKLNSTDGYNSGYAQGQADQLYNLEELNETIENKDRQLQELQNQYDNLLDHYNTAQIDNPLSQMVVSIADIPLNLFHEMFDFNILGFNLSAFILGIITILLVAYVIKLFL